MILEKHFSFDPVKGMVATDAFGGNHDDVSIFDIE